MDESNLVRVDLTGALEGRHILVDPKKVTFGLLVAFDSGRSGRIFDACVSCIKGGDLPYGTDAEGIAQLDVYETTALIEGVGKVSSASKR